MHNHRLGIIVPVRATASLVPWSFSCNKTYNWWDSATLNTIVNGLSGQCTVHYTKLPQYTKHMYFKTHICYTQHKCMFTVHNIHAHLVDG